MTVLLRQSIGDAADELQNTPKHSQDVIVADIFQGAQIPKHVSTVDFLRDAKAALKADGSYIANIMDVPPLKFARQQAGILREVFEYVAVISDASVLRGRRMGNLILVVQTRGAASSVLCGRWRPTPFRSGSNSVNVSTGSSPRTARTARVRRRLADRRKPCPGRLPS